jgi:rhodanese-related sulfurtransferase
MRLFSRPNRVDATRAAELLKRGDAVVLDVRENLEWKAGRIPGRRTSRSRTSPLDGTSFRTRPP